MDAVFLCELTKQISDFTTINVSNVSRQPLNKVRHSCKENLQVAGRDQQI
jgi:hypothetical protein